MTKAGCTQLSEILFFSRAVDAGFEAMKSSVIWDIRPCSPVKVKLSL
jgi:hypothetical protein